MEELLRLVIEAVVFLLMLVVGMDCTVSGFHKCAESPWLIATITITQFVCIPAIVFAVTLVFGLAPAATAGLLLISACPSGSISNTYTFLAKGDTCFSVTLTAISCLASFIATPLALSAIHIAADSTLLESLRLPWQPLVKQIFWVMVLPILLGSTIRHVFPDLAVRVLTKARILSSLLVIALVVMIISTNPTAFAGQLTALLFPALVITGCLFGLTLLLTTIFKLHGGQEIAVFFELPCRNLAIAALLGFTVFGQPQLVFLATAFFVVEAVVLLMLSFGISYFKPRIKLP